MVGKGNCKMNYNAPEFWIDGGLRHGIGYGSISDGEDIWTGDYNKMTSNEAEYTTLLVLLKRLPHPSFLGPVIYSDSKLMISQVRYLWRVKAVHLLPFVKLAQKLVVE